MAGHHNPEVGRAFENGFVTLLERLGYRIWRIRDSITGIDVVATFNGKPLLPENHKKCSLRKPLFSPDGVIAFSAKKGNFGEGDLKELEEKISNQDTVIIRGTEKPIEKGVIVTNYTTIESKVTKILERGLYCWDIIRLYFYANKARICYNLSQSSPIQEYLLDNKVNGSYIINPYLLSDDIMKINVVIFIDEYKKDKELGGDHITHILKTIHDNTILPIVESTPLDIELRNEIHILNHADRELLDKNYVIFAGDNEQHPNVTYLRNIKIYTYESSPWLPILSLSTST